MNPLPHRRHTGLTFVEMVVVLGIMALMLTMFSFARWARGLLDTRVQSVANELVATVDLGQEYARSYNRNVELQFVETQARIAGIQLGFNLRIDGSSAQDTVILSTTEYASDLNVTINSQVRKILFSAAGPLQFLTRSSTLLATENCVVRFPDPVLPTHDIINVIIFPLSGKTQTVHFRYVPQ
jgi:Tfp pilus assembly protein FimT